MSSFPCVGLKISREPQAANMRSLAAISAFSTASRSSESTSGYCAAASIKALAKGPACATGILTDQNGHSQSQLAVLECCRFIRGYTPSGYSTKNSAVNTMLPLVGSTTGNQGGIYEAIFRTRTGNARGCCAWTLNGRLEKRPMFNSTKQKSSVAISSADRFPDRIGF